MVSENIIELAKKKTLQTNCKYHVAAIGLDKKGNVISTTRNLPRFSRKGGGIHAEMDMMRRYADKVKTIIIFKVSDKGVISAMHPCVACSAKADELNIEIKSLV